MHKSLLPDANVFVIVSMLLFATLKSYMCFYPPKEKKKKKEKSWGRLVCVFKNWKLLFKNIYENMCGWKSVSKYVKCCLKTENDCLKTQTKHHFYLYVCVFCHSDVFAKYLISAF